jgi:hypothetical protein
MCLPCHMHRAAVRLDPARRDLQQRRLAGAVATDQRQPLARHGVKRRG